MQHAGPHTKHMRTVYTYYCLPFPLRYRSQTPIITIPSPAQVSNTYYYHSLSSTGLKHLLLPFPLPHRSQNCIFTLVLFTNTHNHFSIHILKGTPSSLIFAKNSSVAFTSWSLITSLNLTVCTYQFMHFPATP